MARKDRDVSMNAIFVLKGKPKFKKNTPRLSAMRVCSNFFLYPIPHPETIPYNMEWPKDTRNAKNEKSKPKSGKTKVKNRRFNIYAIYHERRPMRRLHELNRKQATQTSEANPQFL